MTVTTQPVGTTAKVLPGECLTCYLEGVIEAIGCHGDHTLTEAWIAAQPDRPGWVLPWVLDHGGACDCEVLFNATSQAPAEPRFTSVLCEEARRGLADSDEELDEELDEDDEDDL